MSDVDVDDETSEQGVEPWQYTEGARELRWVRGCGACCFVLVGLLALTWVFNALPVAGVQNAPPFARSVLWISVAHHTHSWEDWYAKHTPPPPPPTFF